MQLACCEWVCVCVCVCVCVSPQPFVQGNDRERVPDPNWASGTLHTPPVIRCMHLMQYQASITLLFIQTIREDKRLGEWCLCVCVCMSVCVCLYMCNYSTYVRNILATANEHYSSLVCIRVCVCVCVCDAVPIPLTSTFHARK